LAFEPARSFSTFLKLAVDASQRFFQGLNEIRNRLVPSVHLDPRRLLEFSELGLRQIQKRAVIAFEGVARHRRKRIAQKCFAFG
jgi:hypothetical protein